MNKLNLENITLVGIDTVDTSRLLRAFSVCESYANFADKKLITRSNGNYTTQSGVKVFHTNEIDSIEDYCIFVIKRLNDFVDTSHVLLIQYDGFILNPKAWTDEFLDYDYIGAPWWYKDENNVGNGGFSLRSKKLLEILQNDDHVKKYHPEDHHICRTYGAYLRKRGIRFAPEPLAAKFSIEGALRLPFKAVKFGSVWTNEFGFHGLDKTDISQWEGLTAFKAAY